MSYDLIKIQHKVKKYLDKERFYHTLGVRYTCASLAMCHDYSMSKAEVAGLLHDCAKDIPGAEKLALCRRYNIEVSAIEKENPSLLHAKLGRWIASYKYDIKDIDILNAIQYHTTGRAGMSVLEKIVYIADFIEPGRPQIPGLDTIRKMAFHDLDQTMYLILESTLSYLMKKECALDPMTEIAYNYYKELK